MIKVIGLLKRRPGMSVEEFRKYYESTHRVIGEKYLSGFASRYMRRYLNPSAGAAIGDDAQPDYDVILEIWYPDRAAHEAASRRLALPEVAAEIAEDEEQLFDRARNRFFVVEECESELVEPG